MKHKLALVSASLFAMCGVVSVAHATSLEDVCNAPPLTQDTKVTIGGNFSGDCRIDVDNARLEIRGVTIAIKAANGDDGELRIEDVTMEDVAEDEKDNGGAELVIKNAKITADDRLRIEGAWNGGVTFKNNEVDTEDDLRVKPIGSGDLTFKNNRGQVVDDIRLGDVIKDDNDNIIGGLNGDTDVRNNRITLVKKAVDDDTELVVQSFDGDIEIKKNTLGNGVERIDITSSGSGDIDVKNNSLGNTETDQAIMITSEDGDVSASNNRFAEAVDVDSVEIESTTGQCESRRNTPDVVDQIACQSP
jgi:hypothetical protein